jgi:hypothetical protein
MSFDHMLHLNKEANEVIGLFMNGQMEQQSLEEDGVVLLDANPLCYCQRIDFEDEYEAATEDLFAEPRDESCALNGPLLIGTTLLAMAIIGSGIAYSQGWFHSTQMVGPVYRC